MRSTRAAAEISSGSVDAICSSPGPERRTKKTLAARARARSPRSGLAQFADVRNKIDGLVQPATPAWAQSVLSTGFAQLLCGQSVVNSVCKLQLLDVDVLDLGRSFLPSTSSLSTTASLCISS